MYTPNQPLMGNDYGQPPTNNAYTPQYQPQPQYPPQPQHFNQYPPQPTPQITVIRMPVNDANHTAQLVSNSSASNTLPENPVFLTCPGCNTNGKTKVKREYNNCLNVMLILSVFMIFAAGLGLLFLVCLAPCWYQSRIWTHTCERCGRTLGKGRPTTPICSAGNW